MTQTNEARISWIYKTSKQSQITFFWSVMSVLAANLTSWHVVQSWRHFTSVFLALCTSSPWLHFITPVLNRFQMCHLSLLHTNGHNPVTSTRQISLLYFFFWFFLSTTLSLAFKKKCKDSHATSSSLSLERWWNLRTAYFLHVVSSLSALYPEEDWRSWVGAMIVIWKIWG